MWVILLVLCCFAGVTAYYKYFYAPHRTLVLDFEKKNYNSSYYETVLISNDLCVSEDEHEAEYEPNTKRLKAAGLFDVSSAETIYAHNIHKKLYPASTTKILTALIAIKHCNMDDIVTISKNASADSFAWDEATCGLEKGDKISLENLLYGLLLCSGNDTAVAIAEHISGSVDEFAELMNAQANELMATNSHFMNPSGLYHSDHYTTAYDLYLIFNECIKQPEFVKIISAAKHTAEIESADGTMRKEKWIPTNFYATEKVKSPDDVTVIGGKTGTLEVAGNCLIIMAEDKENNPYISVVMGSDTKKVLYQDMNKMMKGI